jgi:hypothetical protein
MSNTIRLFETINSIGTIDKTVIFKSPIQLPADRTVKIRVSQIDLYGYFPNIFEPGIISPVFHNNTLTVSTNRPTIAKISLETGVYNTIEEIMAAINAAINTLHWWQNPDDPGFTAVKNTVIDRFVFKIDSMKLNPVYGTLFAVSFDESIDGSQLWKILGLTSTSVFPTNGIYRAPNPPDVFIQGPSAVICCSIMPPRIVNDGYQPYLADVNLVDRRTTSDLTWPTGNVGNDNIVYSGSRTISQARFYMLTPDGKPVIMISGYLKIELLFYW